MAVGGSDGVVRLFSTGTLQYMATLPRPAPCGAELSPGQQLPGPAADDGAGSVYPDAVCLSLTPDGKLLSVIYSDRSLYVWAVFDPASIKLVHAKLVR